MFLDHSPLQQRACHPWPQIRACSDECPFETPVTWMCICVLQFTKVKMNMTGDKHDKPGPTRRPGLRLLPPGGSSTWPHAPPPRWSGCSRPLSTRCLPTGHWPRPQPQGGAATPAMPPQCPPWQHLPKSSKYYIYSSCYLYCTKRLFSIILASHRVWPRPNLPSPRTFETLLT